MLWCLASNNECQWDLLLSDVIISYNNASQSQLSMSPSKFLLTIAHSLSSEPCVWIHSCQITY